MTRAGVIATLVLIIAGIVYRVGEVGAYDTALTIDSPNPGFAGRFGRSVATGDLFGDGQLDVAVGSPGEWVGGSEFQGRAYVFSAGSGTPLMALDLPVPQGYADFGYAVAMGDLDGDGRDEVVVGAPGLDLRRGRVYIFSGVSGVLIRTLSMPTPQHAAEFGRTLAVGDVNGDGADDVIAGVPYATYSAPTTESGTVYVFDGPTGLLLNTLGSPNPLPEGQFGYAVALGDMDNDGTDEIVVGAPNEGVISLGNVYVFSGVTGALLDEIGPQSSEYYSRFGSNLAMGDANADGSADIAVRSFEAISQFEAGRTYLLSGADGSVLATFDDSHAFADSFAIAMGDSDGDGYDDVAITSQRHVDERVRIYSGRTQSLLAHIVAPTQHSLTGFGDGVAFADSAGDGTAELLVGAGDETAAHTNQGRVYAFSIAEGIIPPPDPVGGLVDIPSQNTAGDDESVLAIGTASALAVLVTAGHLLRRAIRKRQGWTGT